MLALRRRLARASCALASAAVLYGPPKPTNEIGVSLGGGAYDYYPSAGCDQGPQRQGRMAEWSAHFRHERERATLAADIGMAAGREDEDGSNRSWRWGNGLVAARGGMHWRYFAFEIGPALYYGIAPPGGESGGSSQFILPLPSVQTRLGPELLHLWGAFAVPMPGGQVGGVGLGHISERLRFRLGAGVTTAPPSWLVLSAEVAAAVRPNLWLGLAGQMGDESRDDKSESLKSGQVTLSYRF